MGWRGVGGGWGVSLVLVSLLSQVRFLSHLLGEERCAGGGEPLQFRNLRLTTHKQLFVVSHGGCFTCQRRPLLVVADNVLDRRRELEPFLDWIEELAWCSTIVPTECGLLVAHIREPAETDRWEVLIRRLRSLATPA